MPDTPTPRLLCFLDAMCSWCYGFTPVMDRVAAHFGNRLDYLTFTGGLRPFSREPMAEAMREKLAGIYQRISEISGQPFAAMPRSMDPGFIYDTEPASRAIVTMRHAAPGEDYPYYRAIQQAFYARAEDITQEDVLAGHAEAFGVERAAFLELFRSEPIKQAVLNDFGVAKQFGIEGFPTLVLHRTDSQNPNALLLVGQGYAPTEEMIERIEAGLAAEV
ncbi:MAG: DsbA family protein [Beijerinckiaceae bacterium]|jgi:putative protein-disulfide isomerase|nr:DsbA family protein [Beijerinckiaceae bacterium]